MKVDDFELTTQYYHLRGQSICNQHILANYCCYGELASVLAQFSALCTGFIHDLGNGLSNIHGKLVKLSAQTSTNRASKRAINQAKALTQLCGWRIYALQEISPNPPRYPEPANLPKFIPSIVATLTPWRPPGVKIKLHTTESRLIVANYGYSLRLALLELLLNAVQALPGEGQIEIFLQRLDRNLAQIEIVDTGPGLIPGDPEQCFDLRFTTGTHPYGLGLYVARKIIEKHRGTLTLHSEPNGGTRVVIQLPTGNPEPDWEDESALVRTVEALYDIITGQRQEIEAYQARYDLPREERLSQLSILFTQLSRSVIEFVATNLAHVRHLLAPFSTGLSSDLAEDIRFIFEKCDYCDLLLSNVYALDPAWPLQRNPLDLNRAIRRVIQLMTWRVQPGTELRLNLAPSLPLVQGDATLIAAGLLNLWRNALDAAGANGWVEAQTFFDDDKVAVRLTNTGNMIPLDEKVHIFDLDYTTRQGRTYGVGLHIVQAIIARHAGFINVKDIQQIGVTFEVVFPRYMGYAV